MLRQKSPFEVLNHTFLVGAEPLESDARLRPIADCVSEVLPTISHLTDSNTSRQIMWALVAIVVDMALEDGDAEMAAAVLRSSARLLEVTADVDLFGAVRKFTI